MYLNNSPNIPVFSSGNIGLIFKLIEKNITTGGKFKITPKTWRLLFTMDFPHMLSAIVFVDEYLWRLTQHTDTVIPCLRCGRGLFLPDYRIVSSISKSHLHFSSPNNKKLYYFCVFCPKELSFYLCKLMHIFDTTKRCLVFL